MEKIRNLKADEIECRPQQIDKNGKWASLLLYKNARVDMNILDEVYGSTGWQRTHELINGQLFCTIEIWDNEKKCWVKKQDVGTESNMDAEKGRASDAFKRAGFNVGIGRELYTAPTIFINLSQDEIMNYNGTCKLKAKIHFAVKSIVYNDNCEIKSLVIIDQNGHVRYAYGTEGKVQVWSPNTQQQDNAITDAIEQAIVSVNGCRTVEELQRLWIELPKLQCCQKFTAAVSAKKDSLTKSA